MKKTLFILVAGTMVFSGCGKDRSGTYKGNETVSGSGLAAQSGQVTLNITSGKEEAMTGTYASSSGTGTFTGKMSEDGEKIENVSIIMPQVQSGATVNGVPSGGCGGNFTGTLKLADDKISGVLGMQSAGQAVAATTPGVATGQTICASGQRQLELTK